MKNRNEQPSAKQKKDGSMQNRAEQRVTEKVENRAESSYKDRGMTNSTKQAKTGMRTNNNAMENCHREQ